MTEYYVWRTTLFSAQLSFPAGTWIAAVWMNMSQKATQYRLKLGTVSSYGAFAEYGYSFTPIIASASPTLYQISISAGAFTVPTGESLAVGLIHLWENESSSPAGYIFFDSRAMFSSLTGPGVATATSSATQTTTQQITTSTLQTTSKTQQTTTTTQHTTTTPTMTVGSSSGMGWAFAVVGIGIGIASAGAGVAVAASGGSYSDVFAYEGYYYCKKHRVPVWMVQGWLWCPVEQRYLRP